MGILLRLLSPLRPPHNCGCAQTEKHLVRKQQPSVSRATSAPGSRATILLPPFYFFFALTFLQTQFMPSFEGNGQKKAVLVTRRVPRAQPQGDRDHLLSRELVAPGPTQLLLGGQREVPEHRRETVSQPLNLRCVLRNSL